MAFQAAVATWFAVHILVRLPVGERFGINNEALPISIRLETGGALDDIEVSQSDGGALHIQSKTTANLSSDEDAPLTKTIGQLVRWVADAEKSAGLPDLNRNVAMLAVRADAPRTLDDLQSGCRAFDLGGTWGVTRDQRNKAERRALAVFETIAIPAWIATQGAPPEDEDIADLARIFRVARFTMDEGDSDWREASRLLGRHLFGGEAAGDAPLRSLMGIMRKLIGSGAPADRVGLLRALRRLGHHDVGAPSFEADVARLRTVTEGELARLAVHGRLPMDAGVQITRESETPLVAAMQTASLLVIGEPGAGKTGALVHAARTIAASGDTIVFLSVDRFPGIAIAADLASEIGLSHSVVETLAAVPGAGRKILVIDALDAARGGPSEAVFATLIEEVRGQLADDWVVVASIRTFDLKNGRRFRQAFSGEPADQNYVEPGLLTVRHFLVPRLSEADIVAAGSAAPRLAALLAAAPARLADLLRNIFNLSLAAQLLSGGTEPAAFAAIRTQSGLIDAYEDLRLNTTPLQQAAAAAVSLMANRQRLAVRKVAIGHAELDKVVQTGVLAEAGDLVSFAHHMLFDHVAGRFYLAWDDPDALLAQLAGDTSTALLLAPALRFAVERLWRSDADGRPLSWKLIISIYSAESVDPVLGNVALRIAVDNIESDADVAGLTTQVAASPTLPGIAQLLGGLARFAAMDVDTTKAIPSARAIAWARLADALGMTGELALVNPARMLLHLLFDHGDLTDLSLLHVFGKTARSLLEMAWSASPRMDITATSAIRFVGKSFASDPAASRALLDRILREPHFSQYADREAPWLAEQIVPITRGDPTFSVEIYRVLYGQIIDDKSTSWLGGQRSRILPLSSNRRQDYEHARWQLGSAMGKVLRIAPYYGTRALIDALIGKSAGDYNLQDTAPDLIRLGSMTIEVRGHDIDFNAWDEEDDDNRSRDDDLLLHFVRFLTECSIDDFKVCIDAASAAYATGLVWARLLGVGSRRVTEVSHFLWPLFVVTDLLEHVNTLRDAIRFIVAAWPSRTRDERIAFETVILDDKRFAGGDDLDRWHRIIGRIFVTLSEDAFELDDTKALRRKLDQGGYIAPNEPIHQSYTRVGGLGDYFRDSLRREGIEVDAGPIREILDLSDALYARVQGTPPNSEGQDLAALWQEAMRLVDLIDAATELADEVEQSAWGHISNAVERVASSPNYAPGLSGLPEIPKMLAVLERLSSSRFPQASEAQE